MAELAESSALGDQSKIDIGLGAIVVVNGDRHSRARRCLRTCNGAYCCERQGHPNGRIDVFHPWPFLTEGLKWSCILLFNDGTKGNR